MKELGPFGAADAGFLVVCREAQWGLALDLRTFFAEEFPDHRVSVGKLEWVGEDRYGVLVAVKGIWNESMTARAVSIIEDVDPTSVQFRDAAGLWHEWEYAEEVET
jgi:hypothetical protein